MGGFGSGRWQQGKRTTADALRLDIRRLHREGLLTPGNTFSRQWTSRGEKIGGIQVKAQADCVILSYRSSIAGGEWQQFEYPVAITWTDCNFGGRRIWFLCPECRRRVLILFARTTFACRHCHQLVYRCQRIDEIGRAHSRMFKIQDRLGWKSDYGPKPKGMHWRTFLRLVVRHHHFSLKSMIEIVRKFNCLPA